MYIFWPQIFGQDFRTLMNICSEPLLEYLRFQAFFHFLPIFSMMVDNTNCRNNEGNSITLCSCKCRHYRSYSNSVISGYGCIYLLLML